MSNYAYNSSNELTAEGSTSYTYDDNGNTLTKTDSAGTTTYSWDFENRLTSVQLPNSTTVSFKYDPFGRRIQKSGASTTNYVYDGANVIEETDQSGNLLAHYSQGAGIDEPLSQLRSGAVSYYEQDGLGSVTSLSSTGGNLANTYIYDSFGNLSSSSGNITNPYQYTGRDYDPETGLRFSRARYYDVTMARFLNEDPAYFAGGINRYIYVTNNSINFIDPFGLQNAPGSTTTLEQEIAGFFARLEVELAKDAAAAGRVGVAAGRGVLGTIAGIATVVFTPTQTAAGCADELYKPDGAPCTAADRRPKSDQACKKNKPTEEQCEEMYAVDTAFCSTLRNPRDRAACRAQASERYANCLAARPIPPLPWRRPN